MTIAINKMVPGVPGAVDCSGALIRAQCRHLATVIKIRGEIDAVNIDQVAEYVRRFVLSDSPIVLDLSDLSHFSSAGISLFCVLDEECRAAGVEWTIVANPAVKALLGEPETFPVARSVPAALRHLSDAIAWRRRQVLELVKKSA
ncbi:STAS domain-containing protein [Mycobacterium asiaticum]|nr:STAS domain-containing protein [Mycobacterium asiaticum]